MADINIGGTLHSTATGNVVARANEILDTNINKKQSQINTETNTTLAEHESAISGLNSQNYVSVDSYSELPSLGDIDTIYRVGSWDGTQVDATKYAEYAWKNTGIDQGEYVLLSVKTQVGEVFDISAYHATGGTLATYVDLTAALGTNGVNVPVGVRKGGMSIKFVQSSDNKYVQYRLTTDEWSSNTEDWAIAEEGVYVDNPEFIYVKTDTEDKILWAIKKDGGIYYGAGVPQQVIDYINEKIADLSLDEYEDIVAFLNGLEEGDKTLQTLLNEKVDKEEGKSLIDSKFAEGVSQVETLEFVKVVTDNENKILYGVKADGNFFFGAGCPQQVKDYIEEKIAELSLDEYEDVVAFLSDYLGSDTTLKTLLDNKLDAGGLDPDALNSVQVVQNHEWLSTTTDSEGRILGGRKTDGTVVENMPQVFDKSSGNIIEINDELRLSSEAEKKLEGATYGVKGDILTLHPKEVILPLLKTFKCRISWLTPYQNNYRYVNFNLLWFADLHHVDRRLARITKFYNKYKDYIDDVVCSGDSQNTYWEDTSFWQVNGGSSYLNVIGNHECLGGDRREGDKVLPGFNPPNFSQKECYDRFFKDYLSDTGITIQENKSYWYKDYMLPARDSSGNVVEGAYAYKIRIIGVDHYHWKEQKVYSDGTPVEHYPDGQPVDTGEQQIWLRNLLEDAKENDFSVICVEHTPVAKSNFDGADTSFQCKDPYYEDVDPVKTEILDEVQTFIDNGGKFITWLTGHTHDDRFGTITSHPDQLMITIGTAGNYIQEAGSKWEFTSFYDRTENTINDDLFNIVSINVYGGTISMYRVGCNYDKHGRHIDSIAYDYVNKQIL